MSCGILAVCAKTIPMSTLCRAEPKWQGNDWQRNAEKSLQSYSPANHSRLFFCRIHLSAFLKGTLPDILPL
jgi:hypothetical protein